MWWSGLAPKNLSVVLVCVELMSVVLLCVLWINDDVLNLCDELQWFVLKMAIGKFCDLLCAMVCVLLWWKMRKQWRFFVNILWWKLPCYVTKINIPYGLPCGAKLCRHMARICDNMWHDSNDPRGRHNEHVVPPWKLTWHWPRGSGHVTCQRVTQSQVSRRRGPRHVA